MCEKLRCIDDLLEDAWDFRCPRYRDETYRIEEKDKRPTVVAMKFMNKRSNDRLYCREINYGNGKDVIICEIHTGKKTESLSNKEKNIIKRTRSYEFEILT